MIWCIYSSKHFFYYQDIFKTSSGSIQDIFSGTIFCPAKRFEDILKTSWNVLQIRLADNLKTPWGHLPRRLEDVLKTSSLKKFWRRLGRGKIVPLKICWRRFQGMSWRRLQDVLKTNKCLLGCCSKKTLFIKLKEAYKYKGKKTRKRWKEFLIMLVHSLKKQNKKKQIVNG